MREKVDLIVIGSGPGGYTSAIRASQKGLKVILTENDAIGGTCLNRGCIPTKSLFRDGLLYGNQNVSQDIVEKIFHRKDQIVERLVSGIEKQLVMRGISIIKGRAVLKGDKTVEVTLPGGNLEEMAAKALVIATGAKAEPEPGMKWDGENILNTNDAIRIERIPASLAVIGGGKRSIEFATFFKALGVEVTVIESQGQILEGFDKELVTRMRRILTDKKIQLKINSRITDLRQSEKNEILLSLETKRGLEELRVEKVLMPGKRKGCVEEIGLERTGISIVDGFIHVNPNLETSVSGIYAVGDVIGGRLSAQKAIFEGMCVVDNFMGNNRKIKYGYIPRCLWGDPEMASVGLTQQEAEDQGKEIEIGKFPFMASGRASTIDQIEGVMKVLSGKKYGEILGVHIIGPQATELIALGSMAINNELGVEEIKNTIFAHPTLSESFFEAALDVHSEAIHFMKGF